MVRHYGLPWRLPSTADTGDLIALMRLDKKAAGTAPGHLTFVLDGPNGAELVRNVPEETVKGCLADMPSG